MRLIWSLNGQLYALNVLGVVNATNLAITQALANTVGAAVKTAFTSSSHDTDVHTSVSLANVGLRDIRTASQAEFLDSGAAVPGTSAGDVLPPQIALCITLRTALAGAAYRGRSYLPGYGELYNTATGTCVAVAPAVAFLAAIKSGLQTNALDLGVISRGNASLPIPRAPQINVVTSIVSRDAVWETQRRRAIPGI